MAGTVDRSGPGRPRKPTTAERRQQRSQVDSVGEVLDAAARYLEARPRAVAELRDRLVRLGFRAELVDEAVSRLLAAGYLDDASFVQAWVESRDRARPRGEHALRLELARKGVDRTLIDEALAQRREEGARSADGDGRHAADEVAAERLLRKRLPAIEREADPRRRRQKAYALLARNGFSPDICSAVSRRIVTPATDVEDGPADGAADES